MATDDYFPHSEVKLPAWYANLSRKFGTLYAAALGMTDDVAGLQNDTQMVTYLVNSYKNDFDKGRLTVTNFANQMMNGSLDGPSAILPYPVAPPYSGPMVAPNINGRTRKLVSQIKSAGGYTADMGRDMGIVAPESDHAMSEPALEIEALSGLRLRVKWRKGEADALELMLNFGQGYPKRGERFTRTPFEFEVELPADQTAPVAVTVKARYIEDDKPTGDFGPEYPVTIRA